MVEVTINGARVEVEKGVTILQAAKQCSVTIPTLCNHEGLLLDGNCRICSVEIEDNGRKKLVTACMFPIVRSIAIITDSERVIRARRSILQLLVNRNPKAPVIQTLCNEYGVEREERFSSEPDLCIRCGRCVRACETNGTSAIELVGRGFARHVAPPYELKPEACIGCLSCSIVCPTGKITFQDSASTRTIWKREFDLLACKRCGDRFATKEMLDWAGVPEKERGYCDRCRKYMESVTFLNKE